MRARIISSLEKCFPDQTVSSKAPLKNFTMLKNERYSLQVCYDCEEMINDKQIVYLSIDSPLAEAIHVYQVKCIPSLMPVYRQQHDDNYLRTQPGLFPDLLQPWQPSDRLPASNVLNALWLENAGVTHIEISPLCTACRQDLFWSHRKVGSNRGSQGAVIICKEEQL